MPGARVEAGRFATVTGSPYVTTWEPRPEGEVLERDGVNTVWYDFKDGQGPVPTERRLRAQPISESEPYVYLRTGEFLLEGLPEGPVKLTASQCDMTSASLGAVVTAGYTTGGLALALPVMIPVQNGDGSIPRVVGWKSSMPNDGFVVSVAPEGDRLTYAPAPPNLTVTLQAPPYSGGTTIAGFEIIYEWRTAAGETASLKSPRIPLPPLMVPASSETCPGAAVSLDVPLGTAELTDVFIRQGAGQVIAKVRFIDEAGFEVQDTTLEALEAAANLRKL